MLAWLSGRPALLILMLTSFIYLPAFFYFSKVDNAAFSTEGFPIRNQQDDVDYATLGRNLAQHGTLSSRASPPIVPDAFRTPVYPLFAAFWFRLFGSFAAAALAQVVLTGLTGILVYALARAILPAGPACLAAALYVCEPTTIDLTCRLMSEVLFVLLLVAAVDLLWCWRPSTRALAPGLAGLALGAAALTRPIGLFVPAVLAPFYAAAQRTAGRRQVAGLLLALLAGFVFALTPWVVRNRQVTGRWLVASSPSQNLLSINVAYFLAAKYGLPLSQVRERLEKEGGIRDRYAVASEAAGAPLEVALVHLRDDPGGYARYHLWAASKYFVASSVVRFLNDTPRLRARLAGLHLISEDDTNLTRLLARRQFGAMWRAMRSQPLLVLERMLWAAISVLMCLAVVASSGDRVFKTWLFAMVLYFAVVSAPQPDMRFRLPAEPFMFVLAAAGWMDLERRLQRHRPLRAGVLPGRGALSSLRRLSVSLRRRASDGGPPQALVLLYHRVADLDCDPQMLAVMPQHFAEHLEVLCREYQPVRLVDLVSDGRFPAADRPRVALTFDDGYADNLHEGLPLLRRYNVPAAVFVAAGYVGGEREFWWDELEQAILRPGTLPYTVRLTIGGVERRWDLGTAGRYGEADFQRDRRWTVKQEAPGPRQAMYRDLHTLLRPLADAERRSVLDRLAGLTGRRSDVRPSHRVLSAGEVAELAEDPAIDLGAHTLTHPVLAALPAEAQRQEIVEGRAVLERLSGRAVTAFAYPFGGTLDYDPTTVALVREAAFRCACSGRGGPLARDSDRFQIPRVIVRDWDGDLFARHLRTWLGR